MLAFYSIYKSYFRLALLEQLQYRIAMLIWLIGGIIEPLMYLVVWRTVAQQQGGSVGGYSENDFVVYFIALMMVNHGTFTWIMWEYVFRIRTGQFSVMLLKPIHPIHNDIAYNVGYKILTLVRNGADRRAAGLVFRCFLAANPLVTGGICARPDSGILDALLLGVGDGYGRLLDHAH